MRGACEVCGNQYDKMMMIRVDGSDRLFDCFECAVHALAPHCAQCDVRILGHGLEDQGQFFCCASCARMAGEENFVDRLPSAQDLNLNG